MTFARQIGMMPPQGSSAEARMTQAFNAKTRLSARLGAGEAELVAEGVWVVQGQPGRCNVYLIEDDGGVTLFDAGARTMTRAVASAGARLGGIRRVVLGHGHTDHRGVAPALGVPVLCHPDEVAGRRGQRRLSLLAGGPRGPADAAAPDPPAAAPLRVGRRAGEDRGHGQRGRRAGGLPRDRAPRPRARADRAVARVRPPGADAATASTRSTCGAATARRDCPSSSTTSTPSRRARACASSPPGAGGRVAGARQAGDGRRARPARTGRRRELSVGRRGRRAQRAEKLAAPTSDYTDADGNVLTLRGSLTPGARLRVRAGARGRRRRGRRPPRRTRGSARASCCSSGWRCAG